MMFLTTGKVATATSGTNSRVIGICEHTTKAPEDALDHLVGVVEGVFAFDHLSTEVFTSADVGSPVFVVDSTTVSKDHTFSTVAGVVRQVDGMGVWVQLQAKAATPIIDAGTLFES